MKRYTDVIEMKDETMVLHGRDYVRSDSMLILSSGVSSGYISILILALYIFSDNVRILFTSSLFSTLNSLKTASRKLLYL